MNLQKACRDRIEECFQIAEKEFGVTIPRIPVKFSNKMTKTGGTCTYNSFTLVPQYITLSNQLLRLNGEEFVKRTPGHEAAHAIALYVFKHNGTGHGYKWRQVMHLLGQSAERCHSMKTVKTAGGGEASCKCMTHQLSKIRYNKIRRGAEYKCRKCKTILQAGSTWTAPNTKPVNLETFNVEKALTKAATKPKRKAPRKASKGPAKSTIVRNLIKTYKAQNLSLDTALALKVNIVAAEANLSKALAKTYLKNNWNKV